MFRLEEKKQQGFEKGLMKKKGKQQGCNLEREEKRRKKKRQQKRIWRKGFWEKKRPKPNEIAGDGLLGPSESKSKTQRTKTRQNPNKQKEEGLGDVKAPKEK